MMIGNIKIDLEELLSNPPPEPKYNNPFAHKNCDCENCKAIILDDAYHLWMDNENIETEDQLVAAVEKFHWGEDA
jgi:hypothetical protein|tara:strand:- start:669 stop:893 length:225 start_codon:yes stop_codon:yes gene_type:complete